MTRDAITNPADAGHAEEIQIIRHGRGHRLTAVQWLPRPVDHVFEFFSDALNLEKLTPARLQFTVLTPPPIDMREGATIDYRLKLHGLIPISWRSEISVWEPPYRFVDEALRSPYRYWRHEHHFRSDRGGTTIEDSIDYGVPLGAIAHGLLVRRDLLAIFRFRHRTIAEQFDVDLPYNVEASSGPVIR